MNDGANWTNETSVTVQVWVLYGFGEIRYRSATSEEALNDTEWMPADQEAIVLLDGPDGEKWVYHQVIDGYGFSALTMDRIFLDTNPPTISSDQPPPEETEEENITLSLTVVDEQDPSPVVRWRINEGPWQEYTTSVEVQLVEGDNHIEVETTDAAGNSARSEWWTQRVVPQEVSSFPWWALVIVIVIVFVAIGGYYLLMNKKEE